jgi:hypothetical protein
MLYGWAGLTVAASLSFYMVKASITERRRHYEPISDRSVDQKVAWKKPGDYEELNPIAPPASNNDAIKKSLPS